MFLIEGYAPMKALSVGFKFSFFPSEMKFHINIIAGPS